MNSGTTLCEARTRMGWTQEETAERVGVSQGYLSLLERGRRRLSGDVARRLNTVFQLSPAMLPLPTNVDLNDSLEAVAKGLAALGYPGFQHLKSDGNAQNPAVVVLKALQNDRLDSRLAAALPWVLRTYPDLEWEWLLREAKLRDLQNRLGFVLSLAARAAANHGDLVTAEKLTNVEHRVERSRLVHEDVFGRGVLTESEKKWLRSHRPPEAQHWNVLSSLTVAELHA